jgi:hypothetical protein
MPLHYITFHYWILINITTHYFHYIIDAIVTLLFFIFIVLHITPFINYYYHHYTLYHYLLVSLLLFTGYFTDVSSFHAVCCASVTLFIDHHRLSIRFSHIDSFSHWWAINITVISSLWHYFIFSSLISISFHYASFASFHFISTLTLAYFIFNATYITLPLALLLLLLRHYSLFSHYIITIGWLLRRIDCYFHWHISYRH